jgi:hypothetical protein
MESRNKVLTVVLNLMDGREDCFELPPDKAVVAAHELFDEGVCCRAEAIEPSEHPQFKEYRLALCANVAETLPTSHFESAVQVACTTKESIPPDQGTQPPWQTRHHLRQSNQEMPKILAVSVSAE